MIEQLEALISQHYRRNGQFSSEDKARIVSLRNMLNSIVEEKIEIDSFSPLRISKSSEQSHREPDHQEADFEMGEEMHHRIINEITDVYRQLKVISPSHFF
jgi:hypothetical protein